ncbi:MAG: UTP--glucose-1-phosphate uridylyltransferase GalU [Alphaproteobacteria bacterium]|nr:UTP--glucose-1-phosphate uridylyltransferase GalU [Alphaproteobacteria bacterium]NCQ66227.1 UTP--glucose-1-phosphate uridylyltransferase GalU [Alphaproteobacteria bacterium]NCT06575.1 UTP--glucose-1-phosphate uridylyltransferase GalU [Alphaproteobacteria bacterium]
MKKVRKAIFPVGGLGTRFLPATKALPKEMLPIVDKPLIQYAVEEAAAAGIEEFIFVTGRNKTAIEDHFDLSFELEATLKAKGKKKELSDLESIMFKPGSVTYTRQQQPLGLGHAVWCARHFIHDEPFAVLLADDFIYSKTPCLKQMVEAYEHVQNNILAIMEVPDAHVNRYGIVSPKHEASTNLFQIKGVVEKPNLADAPSRQAVVGRYILDSRIFDFLETQEKGVGGEIQLTDAFTPLLKEQDFYGFRYEGERLDCGSKAGYIKANLRVALDREDIVDEVSEFIADFHKMTTQKNKVS